MPTGEAILNAVLRAQEVSGLLVNAASTLDRLRLQAALEAEFRQMPDRCTCCGGFDWDDDE